jgi:hypothetical protein
MKKVSRKETAPKEHNPETAKDIQKRLDGLLLDQAQRNSMLERHFFMYGHSTLSSQYVSPFEFTRERIRINLVQSCVDTLLNKVTKNSPRVTFLTDGGDWDKQQEAKKREKFVYGQFYKSDVYKKTPVAALSALAYGDGYVKVYAQGKELRVDPTLTMSVVVDEKECLYGDGQPRTWFELRVMDKDTLIELYPEKADKIKKLQTVIMPFYVSGTLQRNLVQVVEYWKLSSDPEKPGVHAILAGDEFLLDPEDWKKNRPPFRRLQFVKNLIGYYSKGVAEVVTPYQLETNRTLKRISDSLRLVSSPKVLYEYGSKIVQAHMNNDVGAMIGYSGNPPQFVMPQAVGLEMFQHLSWCIQQAYQDVGISQLSASSKKPEGLNSGKALREYNDIETERFAAFAKAWEQFHVEIADDTLEVAKEITEEYGSYAVLSPDPKGCELINFKEIGSDNDKFLIHAYPTSQIPKDPWGRLEYVSELMGTQLLTPEEGMSLLDFPDTEKVTSLKTSEFEDILATIDYMLTKDKYLPPEPFQNLDYGIQFMKKAYLKYKNRGCPDKKLDLLIKWINDALVMLQPPEDPAMTADELVPVEGELPPEEMPIDPMMAEVPMDPAMDPAMELQGAEAIPPM